MNFMGLVKHKLSPLKPTESIDYKNIDLLHSFLSRQGKIRPRRSTKLTLKQQRQLAKSVKQARIFNLLPFVVNNVVKAKYKKKHNKKKYNKKLTT
jgi:small subunit ribosomal protein S18